MRSVYVSVIEMHVPDPSIRFLFLLLLNIETTIRFTKIL